MEIEDIAINREQLEKNFGAVDVVFENPVSCSSSCGKLFEERALAIFADGKIYAPGQLSFENITKSKVAYLVRIHYNGKSD